MKHDKELGLLRFADDAHRDQVKEKLGLGFEDLYDSVDSVRESTRMLESDLSRILYGTGMDRPERGAVIGLR